MQIIFIQIAQRRHLLEKPRQQIAQRRHLLEKPRQQIVQRRRSLEKPQQSGQMQQSDVCCIYGPITKINLHHSKPKQKVHGKILQQTLIFKVIPLPQYRWKANEKISQSTETPLTTITLVATRRKPAHTSKNFPKFMGTVQMLIQRLQLVPPQPQLALHLLRLTVLKHKVIMIVMLKILNARRKQR
jgi:hypothetical protein